MKAKFFTKTYFDNRERVLANVLECFIGNEINQEAKEEIQNDFFEAIICDDREEHMGVLVLLLRMNSIIGLRAPLHKEDSERYLTPELKSQLIEMIESEYELEDITMYMDKDNKADFDRLLSVDLSTLNFESTT